MYIAAILRIMVVISLVGTAVPINAQNRPKKHEKKMQVILSHPKYGYERAVLQREAIRLEREIAALDREIILYQQAHRCPVRPHLPHLRLLKSH